ALVPFILDAFDNATRSGAHPILASAAADPQVAEAVGRLRVWNFTTPTGIVEGFDADSENVEVGASVAATIYSTWRGTMVANTIDATLDGLGLVDVPRPAKREELITAMKHLLERSGEGESGLNFFHAPLVGDKDVRRDIIVLTSLRDALDLLASDAFAPAFRMSGNQDDYRWGKLHRIVFNHPLGGAAPSFNVPPGFGLFPQPLEGLAGIPVDGGFETVDQAPPLDANNIRVTDSDSFMFDFGPTGRFVARLVPARVKAETSLPGGESAIPGSPFYLNLLEPWLMNETHPMLVFPDDVRDNAVSTQVFLP
ncbi:MAG TPA: penicillin acylase family protein, partial [Gammaproteobacteria bacterium]|nr:penicillin acylase family protein [Gammaproteobacteria bacterium]